MQGLNAKKEARQGERLSGLFGGQVAEVVAGCHPKKSRRQVAGCDPKKKGKISLYSVSKQERSTKKSRYGTGAADAHTGKG